MEGGGYLSITNPYPSDQDKQALKISFFYSRLNFITAQSLNIRNIKGNSFFLFLFLFINT